SLPPPLPYTTLFRSVAAAARGETAAIVSIQIHRFKVVNDQHGYDTGDRLLKELASSLTGALAPDAVIARLSGDEFAAAFTLPPAEIARVDLVADAVLRSMTRPFLIDDKMIQVGAFAGIATTAASEARIPDLPRRAHLAMDHANSARYRRPIWFDDGMERALVAHGEIEQGIRFG